MEEEVIRVVEEAVVEVVVQVSAILSRRVNALEALHADSHTKELEVRMSVRPLSRSVYLMPIL